MEQDSAELSDGGQVTVSLSLSSLACEMELKVPFRLILQTCVTYIKLIQGIELCEVRAVILGRKCIISCEFCYVNSTFYIYIININNIY